jgi:hypothetical protein
MGMDNRTGDLVPLDPLLFAKNAQAAMDKAIPRKFQGPVFAIGEIVEVKGGKFKIYDIRSRGRLYLKGIPTALVNEDREK